MTILEPRIIRQSKIFKWVKALMGEEGAKNSKERAMRLLEEATEVAQAEGITIDECHNLIGHVYRKPVGEPFQEAGGVAITFGAYCAVKGFDPDEVEQVELDRLYSKPIEYYKARHQKKVEAGVATEPQ